MKGVDRPYIQRSFGDFADRILALDSTMLQARPLPACLMLAKVDRVATYYAPFDYVNEEARVVIVGITPGATQAKLALEAAAQALRQGTSASDALRIAKATASFGGTMRANLVRMLDCIGLHLRLGVHSCSRLFDVGARLAHFTSALMYPVFVDGRDYNGAPSMFAHPVLRELLKLLAAQAQQLPTNTLWLPLGPQPTAALDSLVAQGMLRPQQVLKGLPHPSGANAERIAVFTGAKAQELASNRTDPAKLIAARQALTTRLQSA